jgi:hypothetical protein
MNDQVVRHRLFDARTTPTLLVYQRKRFRRSRKPHPSGIAGAEAGMTSLGADGRSSSASSEDYRVHLGATLLVSAMITSRVMV